MPSGASILPLCLPSFPPSSLPPFLPSSLPPFLPSSLPPFLPSSLYPLSFIPSSLPPFLSSSLPIFLPSSLPPFLPSYLPPFLPSYLPLVLVDGHACCNVNVGECEKFTATCVLAPALYRCTVFELFAREVIWCITSASAIPVDTLRPRLFSMEKECVRAAAIASRLGLTVCRHARYHRQGVSEDANWSITTANNEYRLCPTYPACIAVPSGTCCMLHAVPGW